MPQEENKVNAAGTGWDYIKNQPYEFTGYKTEESKTSGGNGGGGGYHKLPQEENKVEGWIQKLDNESDRGFGWFLAPEHYELCKQFISELLAEKEKEGYDKARKDCYRRIRQCFVWMEREAHGDLYTDENMRGENVKLLRLIDKGDLLTDDLFIDLLEKDGGLEINNGRHRVFLDKAPLSNAKSQGIIIEE